MSRFSLILALIFSSYLCQSQEVALFKIIVTKGVVLVDGDTVQSGHTITSRSKDLEVKQYGYVAVLTEEGYAFRLGSGNRSVKSISKMKRSNLRSINDQVGAVHRNINYQDIMVMGITRADYSDLAQDSLTIIWKPTNKEDSVFKVRITNLLDDFHSESITHKASMTVGVSQLLEKERALIFRISSESRGARYSSKEFIVKDAEKKTKVAFLYELKLIQSNDFIESNLLKLANCEIYNFYFDQVYYLNKLWEFSRKNNIEIKHKYYQWLIKEYNADFFLK